MPVIVGVSAPGFAAMRTLARAALDAGAAGVVIAAPSSLRTDDQIVTYYRQAGQAVGADAPLVIQDYPLTPGVVMTPIVIRHRRRNPVLRDAEARRLAGPRKNLDAARL